MEGGFSGNRVWLLRSRDEESFGKDRCQTNEYRYFSMYFSVKHPADCGASIAFREYGFGPEHKFRKHGKGRKSLTGSEFREKM